MTFSDFLTRFKQHFHVPISIIGIIGVILLIVLLRACDCHHTGPTQSIIDSTKVVYVHDTSRVTKDSIVYQIKEIEKPIKVYVPVVKSDYKGSKADASDTCSPIVIDRFIARSDGGYVELQGIVDCRHDSVHIVRLYVSPLDTVFKFVDTSISRYHLDSVKIVELRDSMHYYKQMYESTLARPLLTISTYTDYDPIISSTYDLGASATIGLTPSLNLYVSPQFSISPITQVSPLLLRNVFQINIGVEYKLLELFKR